MATPARAFALFKFSMVGLLRARRIAPRALIVFRSDEFALVVVGRRARRTAFLDAIADRSFEEEALTRAREDEFRAERAARLAAIRERPEPREDDLPPRRAIVLSS